MEQLVNSDSKFKRVSKTLAGGGAAVARRLAGRGSGGQTHAPPQPATSEAVRACARGEGER